MMQSRRRFWGPQQRNNMRTRQMAAPQPDQRARSTGMAPNQIQKRTLPGSSSGVKGVVARPRMKMTAPYKDYLDELDLDDKGGGGLSDPQVGWLKTNILGRKPGQAGPKEGLQFQRQLAKSIEAAGGLQAFIASMQGMPGTNRRQALARNPITDNTFNPGVRGHGLGGVSMPLPKPIGPVPRQEPVGTPTQQFGQQQFAPPDATRQQYQTQVPQNPTPAPAPTREFGGEVGGRLGPRTSESGGGQVPKGQKGPQSGGDGTYGSGASPQQRKRDNDFFIGKGIPLTPQFEANIRQIEDTFSAEMHRLGQDQKQIGVFLEQAKLRAMEDLDKTRQQTDTGAIAAGGFNSGVRQAAQGDVNLGFGRGMEDLAADAAQKYADVASGRAQARMDRRAGIQEALLERTRESEADPSSPIYSGPRRRSGTRRGKRRRSGGK